MFSCKKTIQVQDITNFDVTADSVTYKLGQEVKFKINGGNVHSIAFYSGEVQKEYEFKDGRVVDVTAGGANLLFSSAVSSGTQANQLTVLVSTDFNGNYSNISNVRSATWTDITSRIKLGTTATFFATTADISDLIVAGKPLYVGFKYLTRPQAVNGIARTWMIQAFSIASKIKLDNTVTLNFTDQPGAGFQIVDENKQTAPARSIITTTKISLQGNVYDPLIPTNDPAGENWAISTALNMTKIDLGPDWSTAIKNITGSNLSEYRYTYARAGSFKATFIASNNSINASTKIIKVLNITVIP